MANDYPERRDWADDDAKVARPAAASADLHRRPPRGPDLGQVPRMEDARALGRGWCACYERLGPAWGEEVTVRSS